MSHSPIQPDDELLSAYIDGELTADELRAVEEWLASDPEARALVEELRGVSSAVQALPRASVPAEWTAKLAERLDDARGNTAPATPHHESNGHGDAMPSLPFGRSSRGWWWSAAAIAAAVAIMMMVPREPDQMVAKNSPLAKAPARGGEIVMAAPDAANAPKPDNATVGSTFDAPTRGEAAEGEGLDALAMESSPAPATAAAPTPESTPEAADFASVAEAPPAPAAEVPAPAADTMMAEAVAPAENTYLIVWCDVPPESLREKEINTLLTGNGIVVDETTDTWLAAAEPVRQQIELRNSVNYQSNNAPTVARGAEAPAPEIASSRFAVPDTERDFRSREPLTRGGEEETYDAPMADTLADANQRSLEGETILVDATADQIAGCLAAMQQDPSNFQSITIEPVSELAIQQQLSMQRSMAAPLVAQNEQQAAQEAAPLSRQADNEFAEKLAEESRMQMQQQARGGDVDDTQQRANYVERAQARRLARPEDWYFYNTAPKEAAQGYRLPMLESKDGKVLSKSEYASADKKQQLAELNRYVTQTPQQQIAGQVANAPLGEKQPVQVLFVLRNSQLPDPVAAASGRAIEPAAEPTVIEPAPAAAPAESR
ncbi:anti-sigma factor family protein [Aeoliella sp. SH292]|uniref:anti-sigma factor family protein n=1 Tax=Aeoliella sp. SH292 TaxID=3454464 RepID=UPI003F9BB0AC